jgi:L-fuculose-phosphate aldolase
MNVDKTKKALVDACHRVYAKGFVAGYEGNLSARVTVKTILVTPARMCKGDVTADDLVTVQRGKRIGDGPRRPTAELEMHLMVYNQRSDVGAVIHAHPPTATGFAVAGVQIPEKALPEVIVALGAIPLVPYALPGTAELANSLKRYVKTADAFLLANHGALTVGRSIEEAYYRMEMVEQVAKSVLAARLLGGPVELTVAQLVALRKLVGK